MGFQYDTPNPAHLLIQLEISTEYAAEADLVMMGAVGRDSIDELKNAGYTVQRDYTGKRGGDVLVTVGTTLVDIATQVWTHKEDIERVLTDVGGLVTVCTGVAPLVKTVFHTFKKRNPHPDPTQGPVKMTLEIDGAPITIEAADVEQAEAALILAKRFHTSHPAIAQQVTSQSKVKLKTKLPKTQTRKKR